MGASEILAGEPSFNVRHLKLMMKRHVNLSITFAFFMASTCAGAFRQQNQEPKPAPPPGAQEALTPKVTNQKAASPDDTREIANPKFVPNFGQITPTLFRGGQPKNEGWAELAKIGVNIVVDLRGDRHKEREIVTSLGMEYVPMHWQCSFPKDRIMAQFLTLIRENPGKKVFVHCRLGDDRTAMMIAAYRMAEQRWTPEQALEEMQMYNFNFAHRRLICPGLSHYEEHFMERFQKKREFENLRSKEQPPVLEQPPATPPSPTPQPPTPQPPVPQSPPPGQPPMPQASGTR